MTETKWIKPPRTPEKIREWNKECDKSIERSLMTKSTLIDKVNATGSVYFSKDTMKFFGDSVDNYYLSHAVFDIGGVTCYKLSRKKAVNGGLKAPVYFSVHTFEEVSDE